MDFRLQRSSEAARRLLSVWSCSCRDLMIDSYSLRIGRGRRPVELPSHLVPAFCRLVCGFHYSF